ncbi:putative sugar nucleotidyl transferase [Rubrivirga sp. IMCC43871]|uniref:putative sugar nucleotidyl transferase n=1 Tax=Rubrivirga sp. IMCC43871 TaxID=3391575 RepID=UPI0039901D46
MALCLFEDDRVASLAPLALTRGVYDLRVGARTLAEAAVDVFPPSPLVLHARAAVAGMVAEEHPGVAVNRATETGTLFLNGRWLARDGDLAQAIRDAGRSGEARAFVQDGALVALWHPDPPARLVAGDAVTAADAEGIPTESVTGEPLVTHLWDLIDDLGARIAHDAGRLGGLGEIAGTVEGGAVVVDRGNVHVASGATIRAGAVVSGADGPVWIGPGATVGENAVVRGPVVLGPKATVNPAARVDESAIGYWSKVGGEVHGSVVHSLSSKGHDGYLGNSYLGRWCNLGADTNASNLKNDYGEVTVWDAGVGEFVASGRQFAGLFMGDHSKCSINTMFNTGTVVGVFCNLFGSGFPPRYVPDFSWGGAEGLAAYRPEKAFRVAEAVMARRGRELTDAERATLAGIAAGR